MLNTKNFETEEEQDPCPILQELKTHYGRAFCFIERLRISAAVAQWEVRRHCQRSARSDLPVLGPEQAALCSSGHMARFSLYTAWPEHIMKLYCEGIVFVDL